MAKDEKDEKQEVASTETKSETSEFVQIPKSEYEGWKKSMEDMTKFRTETEDYLKGATVVVNTLASDPELTKAFRAKVGLVDGGEGASQQSQQVQTQNQTTGNATGKTTDYSTDIKEVKESQREEIVAGFENEYGISRMKDEDKREARRKIETYLNEFGWGVKTMPLTSLRTSLEKAFVGTHAEKLREEGKLEGFVQARANEAGIMGSIPAEGAPQSGQTAELTPKQKEWAKKLGVDETKAKETYLAKEEEQTRVPKSEKKAE